MVGYARVARFGADGRADRAVGRAVAHRARAWAGRCSSAAGPSRPTPDLGRVVLGIGTPADLTLYTAVRRDAGERPLAPAPPQPRSTSSAARRRSTPTEPAVHVLTPERAVDEWKRLEPPAIGHERPLLHEFFGRTRTCLATMDAGARRGDGALLGQLRRRHRPGRRRGGRRTSSRWCSPRSTAWRSRRSRRASACSAPPTPGGCCDRLRRLGFRVHWPSWVM